MKTVLTIVIAFLSLTLNSQSNTSITLEELNQLNNTKWVGELMYVNYGDGQEVTLQTKMQIEIKNNKILMSTQYDNEPSANSQSTIKLKKNGTYFGNEKIISKTISKEGVRTLVTSYEGRDANKPATILKTYTYDDSNFSVTKEVKFKGTSDTFIRNKYTYTKL
nr:hypothetical protein [uncultured Psychroserpens sp.]